MVGFVDAGRQCLCDILFVLWMKFRTSKRDIDFETYRAFGSPRIWMTDGLGFAKPLLQIRNVDDKRVGMRRQAEYFMKGDSRGQRGNVPAGGTCG